MNEPEQALAKIHRSDGYAVAQFTRQYEHASEVVWKALTDPAILPQWLASGQIEPVKGGRARLDFVDSGTVIDSAVSEFDEGRTLEYSWSTAAEPLRPVRWSIEPAGEGCELTLRLSVPEGEDVSRSCAGWEAHLDMLDATLEGVSIKFPFERFKAARAAYKAALGD